MQDSAILYTFTRELSRFLGCGNVAGVRLLVMSTMSAAIDCTNEISPNNWTILHHVCNRNWTPKECPELIRWLVTEYDLNVNASTKDGYVPLHFAVSTQSLKSAKELLKLSAHVNILNNRNETPLDLCRHSNIANFKTARLLLDYGARVNKGPPAKWLENMINGRKCARQTAVLLLGMRRFRRSRLIEINGMDIVRLIAQFVWQDRYDDIAVEPSTRH